MAALFRIRGFRISGGWHELRVGIPQSPRYDNVLRVDLEFTVAHTSHTPRKVFAVNHQILGVIDIGRHYFPSSAIVQSDFPNPECLGIHQCPTGMAEVGRLFVWDHGTVVV